MIPSSLTSRSFNSFGFFPSISVSDDNSCMESPVMMLLLICEAFYDMPE
jgi:hypothetical protein